ncbi:hypothetical protein EDB85DRAFT_2189819 [Lactarius pseudohatsudake]|nr:hypothetical protein EDB85DRAFT_2189819 [Lactarius pseudohatsudake]
MQFISPSDESCNQRRPRQQRVNEPEPSDYAPAAPRSAKPQDIVHRTSDELRSEECDGKKHASQYQPWDMQTRHADGSQSRIRRGLGTVRFSVGRRIGPQLWNHFCVAASASPISCSLTRSLDSLDPGSGPLEFIQTASVSRISEPSRHLPSPLPSRSLHPAQYSMQRRTSHVVAGSHAMQAESHKMSQVTDSVRRFCDDTYSTGDRLTSRAIASVYESHDKHARRPRIHEEQSSRSFKFRPIYDHWTVAQMTPSPSEVSAPHFSSGAVFVSHAVACEEECSDT